MRQFVIGGVGLIACTAAYLNTPPSNPPPTTIQVEHVVPTKTTLVVPAPGPKAVVKKTVPKPKVSVPKPKKAGKAKAVRPKERDFNSDVRKLQSCKALNDLKASGKQAEGQYEVKLKRALIPWYITHCVVGNHA